MALENLTWQYNMALEIYIYICIYICIYIYIFILYIYYIYILSGNLTWHSKILVSVSFPLLLLTQAGLHPRISLSNTPWPEAKEDEEEELGDLIFGVKSRGIPGHTNLWPSKTLEKMRCQRWQLIFGRRETKWGVLFLRRNPLIPLRNKRNVCWSPLPWGPNLFSKVSSVAQIEATGLQQEAQNVVCTAREALRKLNAGGSSSN